MAPCATKYRGWRRQRRAHRPASVGDGRASKTKRSIARTSERAGPHRSLKAAPGPRPARPRRNPRASSRQAGPRSWHRRRATLPRKIEGGLLVRGRRAPARALLVAGRGGGYPAANHHVEIELLPPPLILDLVHQPHPGRNTDPGERIGVIERKPLLGAIFDHDLEGKRLAILFQLAAVERVARLMQERESVLGLHPVGPEPAGLGRRPAAFENVLANGARKRRKERTLGRACRAACRSKLGIIEKASGPLIKALEEIGVDPIEIEQKPERLADADIGKKRPAQIEDEALKSLRAA